MQQVIENIVLILLVVWALLVWFPLQRRAYVAHLTNGLVAKGEITYRGNRSDEFLRKQVIKQIHKELKTSAQVVRVELL